MLANIGLDGVCFREGLSEGQALIVKSHKTQNLVSASLVPLVSGLMSQYEHMKSTLSITKQETHQQIKSLLYFECSLEGRWHTSKDTKHHWLSGPTISLPLTGLGQHRRYLQPELYGFGRFRLQLWAGGRYFCAAAHSSGCIFKRSFILQRLQKQRW